MQKASSPLPRYNPDLIYNSLGNKSITLDRFQKVFKIKFVITSGRRFDYYSGYLGCLLTKKSMFYHIKYFNVSSHHYILQLKEEIDLILSMYIIHF